jgi:thiamine biosynthesis protein ThiS
MEIILNGKPKQVSPNTTIMDILKEHHLKPEQVVIELNERIVERKKFRATPFQAGDKIEILTFVGGGA